MGIKKHLPSAKSCLRFTKGESVDFDITTNIGLDVGTYECTVLLYQMRSPSNV
mgnify:CR=1 FL=1